MFLVSIQVFKGRKYSKSLSSGGSCENDEIRPSGFWLSRNAISVLSESDMQIGHYDVMALKPVAVVH